MGVAAVCGQLIGGVLVQLDIAGLGWRSCFLINVPVGALALGLAPRFVPESRAEHRSGLDLAGTMLVTAGVTAIVLPLVEGRQHGWPLWTWISLAAAPLLLLAFAYHQRRLARGGGTPLIAPALFRARSFTAGLLTQLAFWCGQASFFLVLALYLQQGRGLSALHAGLVFTILAVAYVAASAQAPALTERHGRRLLAAGALVLAAGHGLLLGAVADVGVGGSIWSLVPGLLLIGVGMGLLIVPLTTTILSGIDPEHAGAASGALATMQNVGAALGVAITGAIFFGALHAGYAHALELSLAQLAALQRAKRPGAIRVGVRDADDRQDVRHQQRRADALHEPRCHEHRRRPGHPTRHRGQREQSQADREHPPSTDVVAEARCRDQEHGRGQRVTGHDPFDRTPLACRSCCMDGKATLTMKKSSTTMKVPASTTGSGAQRLARARERGTIPGAARVDVFGCVVMPDTVPSIEVAVDYLASSQPRVRLPRW